ncbi:4-hydroxy-tetrahydrodipicolinate synthase [Flagellimonas algicola]|uniref:4-hydroxy-tetrahydrodipicolinate synthase n=1 Tax=Flagellimonas algicola TaxID=2583815 RepID=A0ABY2WPZ6_9FLAO|nr:4-hydroxy-tetrahydrodipicolinate synthase [Allomuricauda algicola]TMU56815.1 4-hydroxy-tetrahydrodipicolinate synthase [Allomuricauda algicola]
MEQLLGTGVALVTPFKEDFSVDTTALERVVEHCIQGGIDYLVALGTTAESATLSKAEKQLVADVVVRANAGRLPLVLGVGGNNTAAVVEELKSLDLSEFTAILSVSPYYNRPTQEGIYQHFKAIGAASPIPIVMYNVPARTGSNMLPETTVRLAKDVPNIVAIKEACGDMVQIDQIMKGKPDDFLVISGDDFTALPTVLAGGSGVISVLGQGLPAGFSTMIEQGLQGKSDEAYELHHALLPAMQLIFEEGNPAGIKSIFESLGICSAVVRLPLVEASLGLKNRIAAYLKSHNKVYA